jgi:hypothetical protein
VRERPLGRWRPPHGCRRRFKEIAQPEIERGNGPQAIAFDRLQRCGQTDVVENRQAVDRVFETPSGGTSLRCPPIFKKRVERRIYLRLR